MKTPNRAEVARGFVSAIMSRYPHPVSYKERKLRGNNQYCVGGAVARWVHEVYALDAPTPRGFADGGTIADALRLLNGSMSTSQAMWYAMAIMSNNDGGNMPGAWHALERALKCKDGESVEPSQQRIGADLAAVYCA